MGIGVVIGAFVMIFILVGVFMLLRKKRERNGQKNAIILVTEENRKNSVDAEKMEVK